MSVLVSAHLLVYFFESKMINIESVTTMLADRIAKKDSYRPSDKIHEQQVSCMKCWTTFRRVRRTRWKMEIRSTAILPLKTRKKTMTLKQMKKVILLFMKRCIRKYQSANVLLYQRRLLIVFNHPVFLISSPTSRSKVPVVLTICEKYSVWDFGRKNKRPRWYFAK